MAKITISRTIMARVDTPLEFPALASFFDACFGLDKRALPKFPQALGDIYASWKEKNGAMHEAESLEELKEAYERGVTYQLEFSGSRLPNPPENVSFLYRPGLGDATLKIRTSSDAIFNTLHYQFKKLFPLPIGGVFVSYDTRELRLAEFLKAVLEARLGPGVPVFVAKRDIRAGEDPTKKMIKENLLRANAIVSICTPHSKTSPWLWWETASVWARDQLVIPLFAGTAPGEFGPITVLLQGRQFFDQRELLEAIREIGQRLAPSLVMNDLTESEGREFETLRDWHFAAFPQEKENTK